MKEGVQKALELNGSDMIGCKLVLEKVVVRDSFRFGGLGGQLLSVGGRYRAGRCGGLRLCKMCRGFGGLGKQT
ncbi:unnamed protein product [Arabis nemorensis]|uniref:Uncharacterized protein n=1 Tax=Arabis nemorensis TaxID=586526 RepID=A0A565AWP9_9BRAS|nr:unnamed protein product [Arabis nemorensis]